MKKAAKAIPNQRLIDERIHHAWSQQEVADLINTTSVNISRWERGITFPGPHFRHQLCLLYGKSSEELGLLPESTNEDKEALSFNISNDYRDKESSIFTTSSQIWNIPYRRNPFFTGRERVLTHLYNSLCKEQVSNQIMAISGLGGIGKTQVAVEYAYRYRNKYRIIIWINAETNVTIFSDIISLAHLFEILEEDQQEQN